jgi:hypothetical protein
VLRQQLAVPADVRHRRHLPERRFGDPSDGEDAP